jgi:hypothetical protein
MSVDGIGTLNVYKKFPNRTISLESIWTKSDNQDNIWRMARVNLPRTTKIEVYAILFEGVKGRNYRRKADFLARFLFA